MIGNIILGVASCLNYYVAIFLRSTILQYLDKKPLGLQSVLDLLIKDLVWSQMIQNTNWMVFLLAGFLHGQLPILVGEIGAFIIANWTNLIYEQYQILLIVKALLIFKGMSQWNITLGINKDIILQFHYKSSERSQWIWYFINFAGEIFADISDSTVVRLSRIAAFTLMSLRCIGDFFIFKAVGSGVMIRYLTGQEIRQ